MIDAVFIDTETHLFGPGNMAPKVVCLSTATDDDYDLLVGNDVRKFTAEILTRAIDGGPIIAAHNAAYDFTVLMATFPELTPLIFEAYDKGKIHCTWIIEKLIDIARGRHGLMGRKYSLDAISQRRLGISLEGKGTTSLDFGRLDGVPLRDWPRSHVNYASIDAVVGIALLRNQEERAREISYRLPDADHQARAAFALNLTRVWGMVPHRPTVVALDRKIRAEMATHLDCLRGTGLVDSKGHKSNKLMQSIVEQAFNGHPPRAPKGGIKIDSDTLETILESEEVASISSWVAYGKLQKTLGTYVAKFYEQILHPSFNALVDSGRTSCYEPNVQNLPRLIGTRECLRARPGYVLISGDFNSQESRTWAQACLVIVGRSALAERYQINPKFDPHAALGAKLKRVSEEEMLALLAADDPDANEFRQRAKIPNFGFPGGMGAGGLQRFAWNTYRVRLGIVEAEELKEGWREQWPESVAYFNHISSLCDGGSEMTQLYSDRRRGGIDYCSAANSYFQGLAADQSKSALWAVVRRCYDPTMMSELFGCRPWNFVHDEVMLEAPEDYAAEAAEEMHKVMIEAAQPWTPDVPTRAAVVLMRHWSNDAVAVRDRGGRLIPYDDRKVA